VKLTRQTLQDADAIVIVTDHSQVDYSLILEHTDMVIDTRGATRSCPQKRRNVVSPESDHTPFRILRKHHMCKVVQAEDRPELEGDA
jgi:hypothetical protein